VLAFANGLDTSTNGVDVVATYLIPSDGFGAFNLSVSATAPIPRSRIDPQDVAFCDRTALNTLTPGSRSSVASTGRRATGASPRAKCCMVVLHLLQPERKHLLQEPGRHCAHHTPRGRVQIHQKPEAVGQRQQPVREAAGAGTLVPALERASPPRPRATATTRRLTLSAYEINGGYRYGRLDFTF
jgi:hypothetical protein